MTTHYNVSPTVIRTGFLTLASGELQSDIFDCGNLNPIALIFPSNTDAQNIGFLDATIPVTGMVDSYLSELDDATGTPVSFAAKSNQKISLDPSIMLSVNRFCLYTGTAQTTNVIVTVVMAPLLQGNN